jgi:hypothetical protein
VKLRLNYLIAAGLVVGLIAAGCGKSSNVAHLTKPQFIAKADAICAADKAQRRVQLKQLTSGIKGKPTAAQLQSVAKLFGDGTVATVTKIRALPEPTGDANQLRVLLDTAESGGKQEAANPASLNAKGPPNADLAKASALAKSYGLKVCGQPGT